MTSPISSTNASYLSAVRGDGVGSVQSLLTQIRSMMGEVDQQVNGLQAEIKGTLEATSRERVRLEFLRNVSNHVTGSHTVGEYREFVAATMARLGIDPVHNADDRAMLTEIGFHPTAPGEAGGLAGLSHSTDQSPDHAGLGNIIANHQSTLETFTNSMSQDSTRLQALMNRRGEFMSTISQCINADHSTSSSIIQNIR